MTSEGTPLSEEWPGDVTSSEGGNPAFDTSVAHQARIYNYWLGGKDNYACPLVGPAQASAGQGMSSHVKGQIRSSEHMTGSAVFGK